MAHSGGRVLEQKAWSVTRSEGIHTGQGDVHTTDHITMHATRGKGIHTGLWPFTLQTTCNLCVTQSKGIHTGAVAIHTTDYM